MAQTAKFRDFKIDDLFFINLRDFDRSILSTMDEVVLQLVERAKQGKSFTCEYKGKILFFFTIQEHHGVASLSLVAGKEADEHPVPFARASRKKIDELAEKYRRLQVTVQADYEKSIKWLEAMGFGIEGPMRKYGPNGEDYIMMARIS